MSSCCKPKQPTKPYKRGIDPFFIGTIIITLILFIGVVYFGNKSGNTAQVIADTNLEIKLESTTHDWGDIDINGGIVSKTFPITNQSSTALKLYDIKTSCMCTTAQLKTSDLASPIFKMHDKNPYIFEIKPDQTANLIIKFDPLFHGPSGVGPITRTISISTNDVDKPLLTFNLSGNVIKK